MKRMLAIGLLATLVAEPAWAQGRRGGGGGGGGGPGPGGGQSGFRGGGQPFSGGGGFGGGPSIGSRPSFGPSLGGIQQAIRPPANVTIPSLGASNFRPGVVPQFGSPGVNRPNFDLGSIARGQGLVAPNLPGGIVNRADNLVRPNVGQSLGSRLLGQPGFQGPNVGLNPNAIINPNVSRYVNPGIVGGNRFNGDWNRNNGNWSGNWNGGNWDRFGDGRRWTGGGFGGWYNGAWQGRYYPYHSNWLRGGWRFSRVPWFWSGGGWWGPTNVGVAYYNPYVVTGPDVVAAPIDYALPLPAPAVETVTESVVAEGVAEPLDPNAQQATGLLAAARAAFRVGDYETALREADAAITQLPSDTTFHEFRAMTLFALGRYAEAAATLYATLAVGPGWTWDTVSGLYGDPAAYTGQLRALEAHVNANPTQPAARFLLAYHYLVIGAQQAAVNELAQVTQLSPNDHVATELYRTLTAPPEATTAAPVEATTATAPATVNQ